MSSYRDGQEKSSEFSLAGESPRTDRAIDARPAGCLQIRNLSLRYGKQGVLAEVSLDVNGPGVTAIIGPSGCGKTSFLMCVNRLVDLIPQAQRSGEIHLDGCDILRSDIDPITLRRRVGMIFQKPNPFPLSIRRNLELPLSEIGVRNRDRIRQTIEEVLHDVGLWKEVRNRLDRSALELSGGQQQRLCLARALVLNPEVLLLDEPCSALDPLSTAVIEELIVRLGERLTVVLVTHNLAQARRCADRVAMFWLDEGVGRLIECDTAEAIFERPSHPLTEAYVTGRAG